MERISIRLYDMIIRNMTFRFVLFYFVLVILINFSFLTQKLRYRNCFPTHNFNFNDVNA